MGKKKDLVVKLASQTSSRIRPIACLPLMRKLLTVIRAEKLYGHLQGNRLFPQGV